MTLAGESGMRLASEHRPMGGADLGSARRGRAFGGALEQGWESGPPGAVGAARPAHRRSKTGPKIPGIGIPDLAIFAVND